MPFFRRPRPPQVQGSQLSYDEGYPTVESRPCDCCAGTDTQTIGIVLRDGEPFAAYWMVWYPENNEAWLDAAIGSWEEPDYADHVTFGCRIGAVDGQVEPACSLVDAATIRPGGPIMGTKLSEQAARRHPWLSTFWTLTDWIMLNDPVAHEHLFHFAPE
jgi:hypothetical protein